MNAFPQFVIWESGKKDEAFIASGDASTPQEMRDFCAKHGYEFIEIRNQRELDDHYTKINAQ